MADVPRGTVTFLFTDIEGSTRLWEEYPEAMRSALDQHDTLLRAAIESRNGYVFRTVGDAFYAAFHVPDDALSAAIQAQTALADADWEEAGPGPLRVRMGLHTGPAEQHGNEYSGPTLNRVARLHSVGWGGQMLLSQATYRLVQDQLPPDISVRDLGLHRLRDLQQPEHIYQLVHSALPADFPPLRSLDNLPNNLPRQLSSFIGRRKELAELRALLDATHLLTLTGTGGIGKTRLALQLAAEALDAYADGVWLVELAAIADGALVPQALATTLGLREAQGRPLTQTLIDYLKSRKLLLLLDNCEHLIDACAHLVDTLLRACPDLCILATSRQLLGVYGEMTWRVPSLETPDPRDLPNSGDLAEAVCDYAAIRLFVERAQAWERAFTLTSDHVRAAVQICRCLDGIPLAIELAAARVRALSVEMLASRLDNLFGLLNDGSRAAMPRHRTLRALIDWSYDQLSAKEQILFHNLAVFSGGWTLDAAETICAEGGVETWEILDLLMGLIDKSLVLVEQDRPEGETRYSLRETIRQYSLERLRNVSYLKTLRSRHCRWYLELAERAEPELMRAEQMKWFAVLDAENENLQAALDWTETTGADTDAGLRLAGALGTLWIKRGRFTEGRQRLNAALKFRGGDPAGRAKALIAAGLMADYGGDSARAVSMFEEALDCSREAMDDWLIAYSLNLIGFSLRLIDPATAASRLEEALTLARRIRADWVMGQALNNLGFQKLYHGDLERARTLLEEGVAPCQLSGDRWLIGELIYHRALLDCAERKLESAQTRLNECLEIKRELDDKQNIGAALYHLGNIAMDLRNVLQARQHFREGLLIGRELGDYRITAASLEGIARIAVADGDMSRAILLFGAMTALRQTIRMPSPPFWRVDHERDQAVAKSALGEAGFAAFWKQGEQMTLDQAIQYAFEEM